MNNKYSLLIIIASLFSLHAEAGGYTGANLGINAVKVQKDLRYPLEEETPTTAYFNNAYTNFHGQLFAGYELFLQSRFSVALEADAELFTGASHYRINNWFFTQNVSTKEQFQYGFSFFLLPAYQINESVRLFVGPGVAPSYFVVKSEETAGNIGVSGSFNQWLTGGGLKAGAITRLNSSLDLVLSYQFMQYNSMKRTRIEPISGDTLQGHYKPNVNSVLVGLRYNFADAKPIQYK
ncbi:outer membrane protein [Legionella saoudiensis]|uniref:outer membrane protein n=1 Tax=Legionella saoudiensis TaxID=1750561 RepID=UPI000731CA2C|nr:outer membrane beta-barrel protein [Legionella saoudiensis]